MIRLGTSIKGKFVEAVAIKKANMKVLIIAALLAVASAAPSKLIYN